jgi:hypothetical protein
LNRAGWELERDWLDIDIGGRMEGVWEMRRVDWSSWVKWVRVG